VWHCSYCYVSTFVDYHVSCCAILSLGITRCVRVDVTTASCRVIMYNASAAAHVARRLLTLSTTEHIAKLQPSRAVMSEKRRGGQTIKPSCRGSVLLHATTDRCCRSQVSKLKSHHRETLAGDCSFLLSTLKHTYFTDAADIKPRSNQALLSVLSD